MQSFKALSQAACVSPALFFERFPRASDSTFLVLTDVALITPLLSVHGFRAVICDNPNLFFVVGSGFAWQNLDY